MPSLKEKSQIQKIKIRKEYLKQKNKNANKKISQRELISTIAGVFKVSTWTIIRALRPDGEYQGNVNPKTKRNRDINKTMESTMAFYTTPTIEDDLLEFYHSKDKIQDKKNICSKYNLSYILFNKLYQIMLDKKNLTRFKNNQKSIKAIPASFWQEYIDLPKRDPKRIELRNNLYSQKNGITSSNFYIELAKQLKNLTQ